MGTLHSLELASARREGRAMTISSIDGQIRLEIGPWELWLSPEHAMDLAESLSERALDAFAEERAKR